MRDGRTFNKLNPTLTYILIVNKKYNIIDDDVQPRILMYNQGDCNTNTSEITLSKTSTTLNNNNNNNNYR